MSARLLSALAAASIAAAAPAADTPPAAPPALADECVVPPGFRAPETHLYRLRGGAVLILVAVHHSHDPADASHAAIAAAVAAHPPTLVLVEGAAASKTSPQANAFLADAAEGAARAGTIGENLWAVKLAHDRGIAVAGWDFSPDENDRNSLADGFAIADIVGAHLLRSRVVPDDSPATQRAVARELGYAARVAPIAGFDYAAWYRRAYAPAAPPDALTGTPCGSGIAARIVKAETRRRTLNLLRLIGENDRPGAVILAEAGANHWLAMRPALARLSREGG